MRTEIITASTVNTVQLQLFPLLLKEFQRVQCSSEVYIYLFIFCFSHNCRAVICWALVPFWKVNTVKV